MNIAKLACKGVHAILPPHLKKIRNSRRKDFAEGTIEITLSNVYERDCVNMFNT